MEDQSMEFERGLIASYEDSIEESFNAYDRLTLKELTAQLCELEARLDIRIGDLPASQVIRSACRRLELLRRHSVRLSGEISSIVDRQAYSGTVVLYPEDIENLRDVMEAQIQIESTTSGQVGQK
jgi:hypothetical protein